jgi:hypothetical protein
MNHRIPIAAILAGWFLRSAALGVEPSAFPFQKELTPPPTVPDGGIGAVILDDEILSELNVRRTNLRLMNDAGQEAAFLVRTKTTVKRVATEKTFEATTVSFKELPDNRVEIVVSRRKDDPAPNALILASSRQNYEKRVSVFGSDDQKQWTPLAADQPIFDYSRYIDVRNNRVEIKPRAFVFYRVEISNVAENHSTAFTEIIRQVRGPNAEVTEKETSQIRRELFRVDWITFAERKELPAEDKPLLRTIDFSAFRQEEDPKNRRTFVYFDTRRQPLAALTLLPRELNFSRRVVVATTDGDGEKPRWTDVAAATISRIEAGPIHQEHLNIPLDPARRYRRYRVTIENQDNPPLSIASVQAEVEVWEALFFQQAPLPRRLLYGGGSDEAPQFDIGTVLSSVPGKEARMWSLGAQEPNPVYKAGRSFWWPKGKYVLVVAIVAMVLLLVHIIAKTAKHLDGLGGSSTNKEG